jgi:uncharacterized protein
MIIEFSVANFRSIKEMQTLSFVATAINEHEQTHTFEASQKVHLLKSVGIYGANGSGKSNVIKAMMVMLNFIKYSFKDDTIGSKIMDPFRLDDDSIAEDVFFQIVFFISKKKYRYGFAYRNGFISSEWLFGTVNKNDISLFTRDRDKIELNESSFSDSSKVDIRNLEKEVTEGNLFLNLYAKFGGGISKFIKKYLEEQYIISLGIADNRFLSLSLHYLQDENSKIEVLNFVNDADIGIKSIIVEEQSNEDEDMKKLLLKLDKDLKSNSSEVKIVNIKVKSQREKQDGKGLIEFDFSENESEGTKKLLNYGGVILDSIRNSKILFIDEFDARLHPILTKHIIKLFNSNKNKSAQLCFVTHDTNLLDKELLRRDQIYFTEKNLRGETSLYSLNEIKGVRNDASFEKDYIKGKYGAIPFVSNTNSIFG